MSKTIRDGDRLTLLTWGFGPMGDKAAAATPGSVSVWWGENRGLWRVSAGPHLYMNRRTCFFSYGGRISSRVFHSESRVVILMADANLIARLR